MFFNVVGLFAAYLLGSIPFGYLLVKRQKGIDIRSTGSGATGATNVMRQSGMAAGLAVSLLDLSKGAAAVLTMQLISQGNLWLMTGAGLLSMLGHVFPVWLGFRGGKGVATGFGAFLVLSPAASLASLVVWVIVMVVTRYASLASMLAAAAVPIGIWLHEDKILNRSASAFLPLLVGAGIAFVVVTAAHHRNVRRLFNGTEHKIGAMKTAPK